VSTCILVVDDDLAILDLYEEILEFGGYCCVSSITPTLDVDDVAELAPSLVILDWFMSGSPAINASRQSIELITRLRQCPRTAHIPILVCSAGGAHLHVYDDWLATQDVALVEKPFHVSMLLGQIAALV